MLPLFLFLVPILHLIAAQTTNVCYQKADGEWKQLSTTHESAQDHLYIYPKSCWARCPCPPSSRRVDVVYNMASENLAEIWVLPNSTTVNSVTITISHAGQRAIVPGPAYVLQLDRTQPVHIDVDVDDEYFGMFSHSRHYARLPEGGCAGCGCGDTEGAYGAACPNGRMVCEDGEAWCAAGCAGDPMLGRPCRRTLGECSNVGTYVCDEGRVVCSVLAPEFKTCESLRYKCGSYVGPCGEVLSCGTCDEGHHCLNGKCYDLRVE